MELKTEDVQSYPRPPVVEPVAQRIRIKHNDQWVVDTQQALRVLETHHAPTYYLPKRDVLVPLRTVYGTSFCEWKGAASYFDLLVGDVPIPRAGWFYARPEPGFAMLRDHVAIYATKVDQCYVGDQQVEPQAGDFYGGWKTPNLRGMVKGAPGTEHW